jgi:hypothetical protein
VDPAGGEQKNRFGVIDKVTGDARAFRGADQNGRQLQLGDVIYVGDVIRTNEDAEAVIKTEDAGMIGVRSSTEFLAEQFTAQARDSDRMTLRLVKGSLRVISGWIGRLHHENYAIRTPSATIGVRGTDHEPYVLAPERASGTPYKVGSYDKVNSGRTVMTNARGEIEVEAGRVGFARGSDAGGLQTRGLMTLLLPVLLDKIPDFYIGGQFENELDAYSKSADATSRRKLQELQSGNPAASTDTCNAKLVSKEWIARFDRAVQNKDSKAILALFSEDASVDAIVRGEGGNLTSLTLSREEFAESTTAAVKDLKDYSQRRLTLDASNLPGTAEGGCGRIYVKSEVVEQGKQGGKPYRFQSQEEFVLERRAGSWLAIHAVATEH